MVMIYPGSAWYGLMIIIYNRLAKIDHTQSKLLAKYAHIVRTLDMPRNKRNGDVVESEPTKNVTKLTWA